MTAPPRCWSTDTEKAHITHNARAGFRRGRFQPVKKPRLNYLPGWVILNQTFSDIWKIVDRHSAQNDDYRAFTYEIVLPSGQVKELKFFGRSSDPLWFGRVDTQIPINIESSGTLDTKGSEPRRGSYLQIRCKIQSAKGCDILEKIEKYSSWCEGSNDIYLLPY